MSTQADDLLLARSRQLATVWQGVQAQHSDDAIRAWFERRYGYPPAELLRQSSIVLVGPVRVPVSESDTAHANHTPGVS